MENHFEICMAEDQLRGISSIGLAHMGDAVFELLVRGWLCQHGKATGKDFIRRPSSWFGRSIRRRAPKKSFLC